MMRPIASACAATCCSKVAGSPLTRRVTMTDMGSSLSLAPTALIRRQLARGGDHLGNQRRKVGLGRARVKDTGAHRLPPVEDRAGQKGPPARLDDLGQGAVDGV